MVLLTLRADGSASLVSFPRDLYVYIPGYNMGRINSAYPLGGSELLALTLEYNMGIRPQHFILTNFNGFKSMVDSLGGVDVNVGEWFHDARPGYIDGFTLYPGPVHMNGEMALWYIRARATTSDLDRLRRSQEVLAAIGQKLFNLNALERVPDFYNSYRQAVVTDLSLEDLAQLVPLLQAIHSDRVDRYAMTYEQVSPWIEPGSGADFLLPIPDAIRQLLEQAVGIR
jgi:LCP family protein required for cell wall assembly